ncbi:hypothetical protein D3C77_535330 [compost metagenome]
MVVTGAAGDGFRAAAGVVVVDLVIRRAVAQTAGERDATGDDVRQHWLHQDLVFRVVVGVGAYDVLDGRLQGVRIAPVDIQQAGIGARVGVAETVFR